ncbi:phage gp6-like head-tail connector protein [Clostridium pasteurianum DSM 525 = ATCC 6013]|uniref:Bacteriophage QLRG family DNA packaging n=1 Tax=Clostridium pasteurianum DSM 525 = ATCC 6013 TaxID=1262449 RepID=A0A0H3JAE4_CLOPA|nr:head-tail connector protein [Clostridium pasteurianum]AJA48490.1 phage gp6-like head-tail connector protein [Clostridium pasteurianum DSM 525 = ATCC 6013]AJA52478.1 phage gp6-like head-tail connector protein [Clostridium pasteurianum DSM 525 = ATCC 6013]AOZ75730.1 hypothetical protein AQ983_11760 [Clostridium pasteurianum DSM 525 = ATCC 6013]AOZ79526.1 hypothetical protein AQ984_11755 [Clostridium pasteurianum]ELP60363.1 hypothetical protein F502_02722 [Clostridium pasteurianum DSM 525 = AT
MLEEIKTLLGISDNAKDELINLYIRKAETMIKNYLNKDISDFSIYQDAVNEYAVLCFNKKGNEGLKQYAQGSKSGTYTNDLPDSVKALLPMPRIKMKG